MRTPREHIEEIRRNKFLIGSDVPNLAMEDLHHAVNYLSAELYAKDVHFVMELIQNAEDNEYVDGVDPSLEFVITTRDITATGAPATLLIFNNEIGFMAKNIDSICSVGRSTKKGNRRRGYIGEKGIGFKSVFLITARPYIFSNGYQIRFHEEPCSQCNVGYIVPEWVEQKPTLSEIRSVYGSSTSLPTTTIVLPLKPDKVKPVKNQLSCIQPELLLFLSKIKQLSVRENNEDPNLKTVSTISISSEANFVTRKNIDADSYMLHLSADHSGDESEKECGYHMWRQKFRVKEEYRVERRVEVEEWVIVLAFPIGKRLHRGSNSPGIYAFLPTEMVTNFPFIIQADFILASSRETVLLDNKWNQGIFECIPCAFVNAFTSLVKERADAPISSLVPMFRFIPVHSSSYLQLNAVREAIQSKLANTSIVPCESYSEQKFFHKPCEVGRMLPAFWNIVNKARNQGVVLHNISSHGIYVISSSFDRSEFNHILNFLGVSFVRDKWYGDCIQSSNLVLGVSDNVYLNLLLFIAENWPCFKKTNMRNVPLLKFVDIHGNVSVSSIDEVAPFKFVCMFRSSDPHYASWLINWNREFRSVSNCVFLPKSTQEAIESFYKKQSVLDWLSDQVNVGAASVHDYALRLNKLLGGNRKLVIAFTHFLYHSFSQNYLSAKEVSLLCCSMPLVDNYGRVTQHRKGILLPANASRWVELIGSNPWRSEGYVELGEDYLHRATYLDIVTHDGELVNFLKTSFPASDVPYLLPPNAVIPTMSSQLTKKNVFLLLDWVRYLKSVKAHMPEIFLTSIKDGCWLKISLSGSPGYRPPSQSFMLDSTTGILLQQEAVLVDIPLIDKKFYGGEIMDYKEELKTVGVIVDNGEAFRFIGKRLMSLADSKDLSSGNVLSILNFIKFLQANFLSPENFVNSIKGGKWLRTTQGARAPDESVLFNKEWEAASQISNIPFVDYVYYGKEIFSFIKELELVGVTVSFNGSYKVVVDNLKSEGCLTSLTPEGVYLILEALSSLKEHDKEVKLINALKGRSCMKTNIGFKSPSECFLDNSEWGRLLKVFSGFPLLDEKYYGSKILSFKKELKTLGVIVDLYEASKRFVHKFKEQASSSAIGKDNVLSLLNCCRMLKKANIKIPSDLRRSIHELKWLRTRLGDYRCPKECILFGPCWESISQISLLPFIDNHNHCGKNIYEYANELKGIGVVVSFVDGAQFVVDNLYLPSDPNSITAENVYSLLECIRNFQHSGAKELPSSFLNKIGKKWVKTYHGHCSPNKCILFTPDCESFLRRHDGPFIDEEFYGPRITSYKKELDFLGVVNIKNGCPLLASYLEIHSSFTTINRVYSYLDEFLWEPDGEDNKNIWIPNGMENGKWVSSEECVIHDSNGLFGLRFHVLEQHYEKKLLVFFSRMFGVKMDPSVDDYCNIWKEWEASCQPLSNSDCCAFWNFVVKNWNLKTEETLTKKLSKVPTHSGSDAILLVDKDDVFIPDDLYLKDLFGKSSSLPLFVWYPQPSRKSLPRTKLLEIYSKIGVRTLLESLQKEMPAMSGSGLEQRNLKEIFVDRGLVRLILGFLADVFPKLEAESRHEAVRCLLDVAVLETVEPIKIYYTLSFSSGNILKVEGNQMVRWDRQISKFFVQKLDTSGGQKDVIKFASHFSQIVSEGVLWKNEDHVHQLAELIRLGFLVKFDGEAIDYLMKDKNLLTFLEDEEFLSSTFPSAKEQDSAFQGNQLLHGSASS